MSKCCAITHPCLPYRLYYLLLFLKIHFYYNSSKTLLKHDALLELLEITLTSQNLYSGQYFPPASHNTSQKPNSAAEEFRGFCDSYTLPPVNFPHCTGFKAVLLEQSVNFSLPLIIVQIFSCYLSSKVSKLLCCTNFIR